MIIPVIQWSRHEDWRERASLLFEFAERTISKSRSTEERERRLAFEFEDWSIQRRSSLDPIVGQSTGMTAFRAWNCHPFIPARTRALL